MGKTGTQMPIVPNSPRAKEQEAINKGLNRTVRI